VYCIILEKKNKKAQIQGIYTFFPVKGNVLSFIILYLTLLHLPPHKFHCDGGCWDWIQDCCDLEIRC
jgi:hypothetical protein